MSHHVIETDIPRIRKLLGAVPACGDCRSMERLGGLTNHTYLVELEHGELYVVRIPGEGTEELICRSDEKISTHLANRLGIDAPLLYFGDDGSKVSRYIPGARTMSRESLSRKDNLALAAKVLRRLHTCGEDTGVPFRVFDMAASYERIIERGGIALYEDYPEVKDRVMQIKARVDRTGTAEPVPCHNDPLCENWVQGSDGRMYLIDWEYAGMNDSMWDLADLSIEADFSPELDDLLLELYFDRRPTREETERFLVNKLYLDFLWALWGKARVPFEGEPMEQYALERYVRLKKNLALFE